MKKILAYITPEKHAGFFDLVIAYDSEVEVIVPYTEISPQEVKDVIYGAVFTRNPRDLKNTAIFIGGHDFERSQELLNSSLDVLKNLPEKFRVSIAFDPDGACTTAASCVVKIKSYLKNLSKKRALILAGTGPVGQCVAVFLSKEGCTNVSITSRNLQKAREITKKLNERYNLKIKPLEVKNYNSDEITNILSNTEIIISTGPEGICLLKKETWEKFPKIEVLADVNAVEPLGIEGVKVKDDGVKRNGKICFGAFAIGALKIKVHYKLMKMLFEKQDIYDMQKIYEITEKLKKN